MKQFLRKSLSLFLSALLSASVLALPAAASDALGEDLTSQDTLVHESTVLSTNVFWSTAYSDLRTENLITYVPNEAVTPIVTYGSSLTSCSTVGSMAKTLEGQGYRVVAGINGDFYNTSTGLPIGLVVSQGEVKSSDGGYYAIGFHEDGSAVLGRPTLSVSADLGYTNADGISYVRTLSGVNKARVTTGGIYLYTYDFNSRHTTGNTEPGVDVVCSVVDGSLSIGGSVTLEVQQVLHAASATAIQPGQVVLSVNSQSNSYYVDALANETVGNQITISVRAANEAWNGVQYAVGALYSLLQDGAIVSGLPSGVNPRTAVGQKADGTLVFYTIDGRQSGLSIGASMAQVAQRLQELGCVTALCLDGGGSTTLTVTRPDATSATTVNSPSGGTQRAVSNQLFLVASNEPTGVLDHFYVKADNPYVLAGSQVQLAVSAMDTNYIPMSGTDYSLDTTGGTLTSVNGSDVLVTPASGGDVTVTASHGGRSGSATIHAISTPDSIAVKNGNSTVTTLSMTPGSSLTLKPTAVYRHQSLKADAGAFTWSLSGSIGTVDANGTITATTPGTGTLTVSAGGKTATVQIQVGKIALSTVEDFEGTLPAVASYSYGAALSANSNAAYVQYGRMSGKVDYTLGSDGAAHLIFAEPYAISSAYTLLNVWVYGDGSGNTLSLLTSNGSTTETTEIAPLSFTGYQLFSVALPTGTAAINGFQVSSSAQYLYDEETGETTISYPAASGTIYLDQLVASYNGIQDTAAPTVHAQLNTSSWTVTATVADAVDGIPDRSHIAVTYSSGSTKGAAANYTYDAASGKVTVTLPSVGDTHDAMRVTILAKDRSGNIGRASVDIDAKGTAHKFNDIDGYWAATYVDFLYQSGITTGYTDGTFRPNQNITRQQFAAMLFRYLGLNEDRYASMTLPFADADQISGYAQTAVKALYSIGIISGTEKNGQLYFNPNSSLTRAQAAAMIGRTQEKGYASAPLSFTDSSAIPAYAAYYIQTMTAQGVIGGYSDGSFRPGANITRGQMAKILYNLL